LADSVKRLADTTTSPKAGAEVDCPCAVKTEHKARDSTLTRAP